MNDIRMILVYWLLNVVMWLAPWPQKGWLVYSQQKFMEEEANYIDREERFK